MFRETILGVTTVHFPFKLVITDLFIVSGTKKPSFIEPGKRKALRARARDLALKKASTSM
jgi:hypothetical protein